MVVCDMERVRNHREVTPEPEVIPFLAGSHPLGIGGGARGGPPEGGSEADRPALQIGGKRARSEQTEILSISVFPAHRRVMGCLNH